MQNQPNAPTGKTVRRGTSTERFFKEWQGKRIEKEAQDSNVPGLAGSFSRPDLAIPCWVAPQQSPTPFRQAT